MLKKEKNNIEILAPAGNAECLKAALYTGADAVYLGLDEFSARGNAENFQIDEILETTKLCHSFGVKVYLTLNTLVFDDEIDRIKNIIISASRNGINAIIVQDIGVFSLVKEIATEIPLHASTQMTITSASGAKALKNLGFKRVVLSRELSLDEIREITGKVDIETEVFIHGALCVSVSGQCHMSALFGGRSGNRGLCAQPCRLDFSYKNNNNVLSLKDLSLLNRINELKECGVTSVKIEGRMKRPEYVAAVTNACFESRKNGSLNEDMLKKIKSVFSRSGFTEGYYVDDMHGMNGIRTKHDVISMNQKLVLELKRLYSQPLKRFTLNMIVNIKTDKDIECMASCEKSQIKMLFPSAEKAKTLGITSTQIESQLSKLGGTPFKSGNIRCEIENGLWLSVSRINEIRRSVLENLFILCNDAIL